MRGIVTISHNIWEYIHNLKKLLNCLFHSYLFDMYKTTMLSRIGRRNRYITALAGTELSGGRSSIVSAAASFSLQSTTSCTLCTPASWQQCRTYNTTCQQATSLSSSITYNEYSTQYKLVPISSPPVVRYTSTSITSTPNQDDTNNRGEELYQQAMSALTKASKAKQKHEEELLKEQFEAMEKQRIKTQQRQLNRKSSNDPRLQRLNDIDAQSANDDGKGGGINDRAAGVAVVRTIVKQSNAKSIIQKKIHVEQSNDGAKSKNNEESEEYYQKLAQEYLEEAAFKYGHPLALVRLGNEALTHSKNSSKDDTTKPLFNTERMTSWILESPIKLGAALAFIEDKSYNVLALQLYQEAGKQGSSEGWYNFGHMLWEGGAVSDDISWSDGATDKEKAIDAFHKAIELQDSDAMYFVAAQYLNYDEEEGGDENENELLVKCYELYGSEFLLKLKADRLENEWDTFMEKSRQPDDESNTTLDSSAQTQQQTDSQMKLLSFSNMYHQYGYALLQYAAFGHEHGPALHHLALLHNQNDNIQTFHQILNKAASTGNPDSLFLQGHCYYTGSDGHNKNIPLALENFLAASESQHVDAMVSAGAILHQGVISDDGRRNVIIQRDQQRAFELYQQAGELGSIEGWRNVVSCYATGQGVPKCIDTAKYIAKTMLRD